MKILGIAAIEQSHFPPFGKQRFFFEAMIKNYIPNKFIIFFFSPLGSLMGSFILNVLIGL